VETTSEHRLDDDCSSPLEDELQLLEQHGQPPEGVALDEWLHLCARCERGEATSATIPYTPADVRRIVERFGPPSTNETLEQRVATYVPQLHAEDRVCSEADAADLSDARRMPPLAAARYRAAVFGTARPPSPGLSVFAHGWKAVARANRPRRSSARVRAPRPAPVRHRGSRRGATTRAGPDDGDSDPEPSDLAPGPERGAAA
jgi:hypothetical protein